MKKITVFLFFGFLMCFACQSSAPVQRTEEQEALFQARVDGLLAFYSQTLSLTEEQKLLVRPILEADLNWQIDNQKRMNNQRGLISDQRKIVRTKRELGPRGGIPGNRKMVPITDKETFIDGNKIRQKERLMLLESEFIKILDDDQMSALHRMHEIIVQSIGQ